MLFIEFCFKFKSNTLPLSQKNRMIVRGIVKIMYAKVNVNNMAEISWKK